MERLLFESKGAPTKAVVMSGVGGGILAVSGNRYYCDFTDETCNTFGV